LFLGEEFHHSSHGMGGATRMVALHERVESPTSAWGLNRVLETVWHLLCRGALPVNGLITHIIPATRADEAYRLVDGNPEACLKVVLGMRT
jgi:threonine dehydrogenase-like Zn-dependent dehydrogenase